MSKLVVDYPVSLPTEPIAPETDALAVATSFLPNFSNLGAEHFDKNAVWRDLFTFTGTLRTFYSASGIEAAWRETSKTALPGSFSVNPHSVRIVATGHASYILAIFPFETAGTPPLKSEALTTLIPDGKDGWKIWSLRTVIDQLKGGGNVDIMEPVKQVTGTMNSLVNGITNGVSKLLNGHSQPSQFECVVVGGGQAGLSVGGRLQALGVNYVILDKYEQVGDSWGKRYTSAKLHTIREYAHLPFDRTFPDTYQEWLSKDDLAKGYRDWAAKFGINIWQKTKLVSGTWESTQKIWTLTILQNGEERSITSAQVILAGGGGAQIPMMPEYGDRSAFKGTILHSGSYVDAKEFKGKHGVVVGSANTGHDVAEDMLDAGCAQVTMIQRSATWVVPIKYYTSFANVFYNATFPTALADKMTLTDAAAISDLVTQAGMHSQARKEPERFDALEKVGFKTQRYGSMTDTLLNRMGGHYMDVGGSEKISKGLIKVKSDSLPARYLPDGLEFENGSTLKADVIVFATGFKGNMKYMVEDIFGAEVAEQMGDFWTLDNEGEIKGAFKPCGHPALWYLGGTQGHARYYSRFVALQVKAALLGTPLTVFQKTP